MKSTLLFAGVVAPVVACSQIKVINTLGPGTMEMTCWEGAAAAAFTPGELEVIQPGETAQVRWVGPGQLDPVTGLPLVRPGSSDPSIVIGDFTGVGARCAAVVIEVNVGGADEALVVWLAPVIQDPLDHTDAQKPSIWSMLLDANNQPLPCSGFQVNSASRDRWEMVDGQNDVYHRRWFANIIPLRGYEGQRLLLQLATSDCIPAAHFGYAAMQVYHVSLSIDRQELPCAGGFVLTAPPGAWTYTWTCDAVDGSWEGESITATTPGTYTVTMETPSRCLYSMTVDVPAQEPAPVVGQVTVAGKITCETDGVEMAAPTMADVESYNWFDQATGQWVGAGPKLIAKAAGTYILEIKSSRGTTCDRTREAVVEADMYLPSPAFSLARAHICKGDSVQLIIDFEAKSSKIAVSESRDFGDGTVEAMALTHGYGIPGTYDVVRSFTRGICREDHVQTLIVHPLPQPEALIVAHCGPERRQRTYEFIPEEVPVPLTALTMSLSACGGRSIPHDRNGMNILAKVPGDSCVHILIEATDTLGCSGSTEKEFRAPWDPVADFVWERILPPGAFRLAIRDSSKHYISEQWVADGATITRDTSGHVVQFDYPAPGEYLFKLDVTGSPYTCPDVQSDKVTLRQPEMEKYFGAFQWPTPYERTIPKR
ncbi:MAG: hypothetical protein IPP83_10520 [Flavobacteriales bacterium]|nr:hypothetical protein [Flavobacteriales bacterium]